MSNGTPPARPDNAINTRWLFPQERAPSPPRDKGCKHNGFGNLALFPSNGSLPPSPPTITTSALNVKEALNAALLLFQQKVTDITSDLTKDIQRMDDRLAQLAIIPSRSHPSTTTPQPPALTPPLQTTLSSLAQAIIPHRSPLSTTTWMSSPTAAGLPNNVADTTIRIEEVCARQDALLEALMGDFRSFADDLDQRQPATHAACAPIDDNDNDDKDVAIHIVPSIADADVEFEDIAVVLAPPPPPLRPPSAPSLYRCGCTLPGGGTSAVDSQHAVGF